MINKTKIGLLVTVLLIGNSFCQNYFPLGEGNLFNYGIVNKSLYQLYTVNGYSYSRSSYTINNWILKNGKKYWKFIDYYYHYDTLEQKVYVLINDSSKIAVDFNSDGTQKFYIENNVNNYTVVKDSVKIGGTFRKRFTIKYDYVVKPPGIPQYPKDRYMAEYSFVDGIGITLRRIGHAYQDPDHSYGNDKYEILYNEKINGIERTFLIPPLTTGFIVFSNNDVQIDFYDNGLKYEDSIICERSMNGIGNFQYHGEVSAKLISYFDYNANEGNTYYYRFRKKMNNVYSGYSDTLKVALIGIPKNLQQIDTSEINVKIQWNYNGNIPCKFIVERKSVETGENYSILDTVASGIFRYTDTNQFVSPSYKYRIKSLINGNTSLYSEELTVYPKIQIENDIDLNITQTEDENTLIKWKKKNPSYTNYTILRRLKNDNSEFTKITTITDDTTFIDKTILPEAEYFYKVFILWGNKSYSTTDSILFLTSSFQEIKTPTNFTYEIMNGKVKLNWQDNATNESNYRIYRGIDSNNCNFYKQVEKNVTVFIDSIPKLTGTIPEKYYKIRAVNSHSFSNSVGLSIILSNIENEVVKGYSLEQNYPNPFNPNTQIVFTIPSRTRVELKIFNILGEIVLLPISEIRESGTYSFEINGEQLESGVYFYQVATEFGVITKKMLLIK